MIITSEMMSIATDFAKKKLPTTYMRLRGQRESASERLVAGKIGEMLVVTRLNKLGISCNFDSIFAVVNNEYYGDVADCLIHPNAPNKKTVDIKTAWKPYHKMLLVPKDMFLKHPKDLYIGVKIDLEKREGRVYGYISQEELEKTSPKDWGEGLAYGVPLDELHPLEELR